MSVRKAHNSGRNHLRNVVDYYQQIGHEKAQSVIDSITSSYAAEGQAGANPMLQMPGMSTGGFGPPAPFGFPGRPGTLPPGFPMPGAPGGPNAPNAAGRLPFPPPGGIPPPGQPGALPFPPPGFVPPQGFPMPGGPGQAGSPPNMPPFLPPGSAGSPPPGMGTFGGPPGQHLQGQGGPPGQ